MIGRIVFGIPALLMDLSIGAGIVALIKAYFGNGDE